MEQQQSSEAVLSAYVRLLTVRVQQRDLFMPVVIFSLLIFCALGLYLHSRNTPAETIEEQMQRMQQTRFLIAEKPVPPKIVPPKPTVAEERETMKEKSIDLTKKPVLAQLEDDVVKEEDVVEKKQIRRVYGLKKVYSMGIGTGGDAGDAIIGKRGNTLNTAIDTITATDSDLRGELVSITRVTTYPRIKKQFKPEYTSEMLNERIEGVVRVRVLVDIDGRVKQVIVLDDLGFGSKEKVGEACFQMEFEPAYAGDKPVSSWILIRVRFELINGE